MDKYNDGLMIKGSILKQLINFAFPLLLGNLFQQLYNTVDSVIVGQFIGNEALAAINSSVPIINLLISFIIGISVGAGVVISQYYGARKKEKLHDAVHTTLAFSFVSGLIFTFIGITASPLILKLMGTPDNVLIQSNTYLKIYFSGILGVILYNMTSGILRAVGDSKRPLYFLIVSSILNIFLDLLFVIVFHMGVAGVAIATSIAQFTSAILTFLVLIKSNEEYAVKIRDIKFNKIQLYKIIKLGLPTGLQNTIVSFSNTIVQANINSFGDLAMAGCGSYSKIDGFAILPVMSFSMALTTFVGQNLGAKEYDRVKKGSKVGILLSLTTTILIIAILNIFTPSLLKFFSSDENVIYYGTLMMRILSPAYIFLSLSHAFTGILRGAGLTKIPMFVMISCWCIFRITWITILSHFINNISIVFLGYPTSWFLSSVILYSYYKKAHWIHN